MPTPQKKARRYWVIAPYNFEQEEAWEEVWEYDYAKGLISIGWREFGDVREISKDWDELLAHIKTIEENDARASTICSILYPLYQSVSVGDIVIARRGRNEIAAIGEVARKAHYDPKKNKAAVELGHPMPHHICVKWQESPRNITFEKIQFGMQTLHEITADKYQELLSGVKVIEKQDADDEDEFLEGEKRASSSTARNPKLRAAAKRRWGLKCYCCNFDFEAFYGDIGEGLGVVHHLELFDGKQKSTSVEDTRVVCANCHLAIHTEVPPIDVHELKKRIAKKWSGWSNEGITKQ